MTQHADYQLTQTHKAIIVFMCAFVLLIDPQFVGVRLPVITLGAIFALLAANTSNARLQPDVAAGMVIGLLGCVLALHTVRHSEFVFIDTRFAQNQTISVVYNLGILFMLAAAAFVSVLALVRAYTQRQESR